ncbi:MAG: WYL domain-containing protein [Clostridia bacterium]|nr:WYL domain-containing protein [Clostridia bacterium]
MIFNEIYSAYYNTVASILGALTSGKASERELKDIVEKYAFGESALTILPALKEGRWQLMLPDGSTPIEHRPTMPMTLIEKRWLKAISLDKRIKLFGIDLEGLEDIEPLFTSEDYRIYDKYSDGDPYDDEEYIKRFRTILHAIRTGQALKIEMTGRSGETVFRRCIPTRLEYSEKDDKFRMHTSGKRYAYTMNLAKITKCKPYFGESFVPGIKTMPPPVSLTLEITDERNALERVMLHFAHFEKKAESLGKRKYRLHIKYNEEDATEMVIRILSFGSLVRVVSPDSFIDLIREKLKKQQNCGLK